MVIFWVSMKACSLLTLLQMSNELSNLILTLPCTAASAWQKPSTTSDHRRSDMLRRSGLSVQGSLLFLSGQVTSSDYAVECWNILKHLFRNLGARVFQSKGRAPLSGGVNETHGKSWEFVLYFVARSLNYWPEQCLTFNWVDVQHAWSSQ